MLNKETWLAAINRLIASGIVTSTESKLALKYPHFFYKDRWEVGLEDSFNSVVLKWLPSNERLPVSAIGWNSCPESDLKKHWSYRVKILPGEIESLLQQIDAVDYGKEDIASEDDESAFPEGTEIYKEHRRLERDPTLSRRAKEARLKSEGRLCCEVCDVDFQKMYGTIGRGFIEAHHKVPVHSLDGKTKTKLSDLALVCSNCHRMLHRSSPPLSIADLRKIIEQR